MAGTMRGSSAVGRLRSRLESPLQVVWRLAFILLLTFAVLFARADAVRASGHDIPPTAAETFPDKATARIVISQDDQQMRIYEGDRLAVAIPVSTGWPGIRKTATPEWSGRVGEFWGSFTSFGTTQDLGFWLYTDYLPDGSWNGDILFHGAPYTVGPDGVKKYELDGIGTAPVSNGCIRLEPADAEWLSRWNPVGVPLTIEPLTKDLMSYPKLTVGATLVAAAQGVPGDAILPAR